MLIFGRPAGLKVKAQVLLLFGESLLPVIFSRCLFSFLDDVCSNYESVSIKRLLEDPIKVSVFHSLHGTTQTSLRMKIHTLYAWVVDLNSLLESFEHP